MTRPEAEAGDGGTGRGVDATGGGEAGAGEAGAGEAGAGEAGAGEAGVGRRPGLGPDFGKLWAAAGISTLGDGLTFAAMPLLAATLTRDPLQVSLVTAAEFLPWLLVGLVSGALVDRWDRRALMWRVDLARAAVVAVLAAAAFGGWATIWLLVAVAFLLGVGQTLFDSAAQAAIPEVVSRDQDRLARANGRLIGAQTVGQQFVGPPAGGVLFSLASWLPFGADAVSFAASSALIATVRGRFSPERAGAEPRRSVRADIAEGLSWLVHHRLLRRIALLVGAMNLVLVAGGSIFVLFAQERLHLGSVGFGLLLATSAAGALLGSVVAARIGRRWGTGAALLGSMVAESAGTLAVGLSVNPWTAGAAMAVTGASVAIFNVLGQSLRQELTPGRLLGRVVSAFRLIGYGTIPLGALLGGVLGRTIDLRAPYLVGSAALLVIVLLAVPVLNVRTINAARAATST